MCVTSIVTSRLIAVSGQEQGLCGALLLLLDNMLQQPPYSLSNVPTWQGTQYVPPVEHEGTTYSHWLGLSLRNQRYSDSVSCADQGTGQGSARPIMQNRPQGAFLLATFICWQARDWILSTGQVWRLFLAENCLPRTMPCLVFASSSKAVEAKLFKRACNHVRPWIHECGPALHG